MRNAFMHKPIFIAGLAILIVGATLSAYSFKYARDMETNIKTGGWNVTWYNIEDEFGTWGEIIGSSTFTERFGYNPISYEERDDAFGFKATSTIELSKDANIIFKAGSDDGVMLFVDGDVLIDSWVLRGFTIDDVHISLSAGVHELVLWWYEWYGGQGVSFDIFGKFGFKYEPTKLIISGETALMVIGGYATFLGQKREIGSAKNVIEKDIIFVIFIFIYLCITFYTILFFL